MCLTWVYAGFWLPATLVVFLFISLNLTLATLTTYLFAQLALRARTHGTRVAVSSLYADARAHLAFVGAGGRGRGRKAAAKPLHSHPLTNEREGSGEATEVDAGAKEKGILKAKYKIFREAIEVQRRWRRQMEEAVEKGTV